MVNTAEVTDVVEDLTTDTATEVNYEQLYNETKEKLDKSETNFKKMAKNYNDLKSKWTEGIDVASLVDQRLSESEFYNSDPVAKEFKNEIKEIQSKYDWMSPDEAFKLRKAINKPELLSQGNTNEWVDGVDVSGNGEITDADLMKMSDEDFIKNFR